MQQLSGLVLSVKTPKTAKIQVVRRWTHPIYHKTISRRKNYLVHCLIAVKVGDRVQLKPIRPMSKNKQWQVVKTL